MADEESPHILTGLPVAGAVCCFTVVGGGVVLMLLPPNSMIPSFLAGSLICASGSFGSTWLAWHEYRKNNKGWRIVFVITVFSWLVSIVVFLSVLLPAKIDVDPEAKLYSDISIIGTQIVPTKKPNPGKGLNYYYKNSGQIAIDYERGAYVLEVLDKMPTSQEIDEIYARAEKGLQNAPMLQEELRVGDHNFNTAVSPTLDDQTILDVLAEKKFAIFIVIFQYTDKNSQLPAYRTTEFCGLFTNSFDYWKGCLSHNKSPATEH